MAYIDSANIKGTLYELQDTQARTDIGDLKSAVDDIAGGDALFDGLMQSITWEVGFVDSVSGLPRPGEPYGQNYWCYTSMIACETVMSIRATTGFKCRYFRYDKQTGAFISAIGNQDIPYSVELNDTTKAYRVAWLLKSGCTQVEAESAIENIGDYITISAPLTGPVITAEKLDEIGMATKDYVNGQIGKPGWHLGYIIASTGELRPNLINGNSWCIYSDEIASDYGFTVSVNTYRVRYFKYDKTSGDYIGGVNWQNVPYSVDLTPDVNYRLSLVIDAEKSDAEAAIANIDNYVTIRQNTAGEVGWVSFLPLTDVYVGDAQQRVYFNELARFNPGDGYFVVSASGATYPEITYTDRYIEFNVTAAKTITVNIAYNYKDRATATKTLTVHAQPAALPAKKVMFLGDSYTQNGGMVKWFKDHNGDTVTLCGTRETTIDGVTYRHEGRGGWTAGNYLNNASVGNVTNPFYNPATQTFDFAYYMANAGSAYTDVDIVNILLGRNSGFPLSNMDSLDTIVASIKAYRSSIIVVLMCDNNLAADNSGAGAYMQNVHTADKQSHIYNAAFYEKYKNSTDVIMCFANLNLDNVYDYQTEEVDASIINTVKVKRYVDNVHPWNIPGLGKFGIALNGLLRNILNA